LPLTLGADLSGEVDAVGEGVSDWVVGSAVFGVTNARFTGAYAEYAIAEPARLAERPQRLTAVEAAATPVVAVTAWQALFEEARLQRGDRVLIHGASGGVGAFAVQLARRAGLQIAATAPARDLAFVRDLGAETAVDGYGERFEDLGRGFDAVIDIVGGEVQRRSFGVLKHGGALVSTVSPPDLALAERNGVRAGFFLVDVTTERLKRIADLVTRDALIVDVGAVLPLQSAQEAHDMIEGTRPKPRGKIVLKS
jgi:NADPH:quinone reductase-like Zn-dependent oxidoreductase